MKLLFDENLSPRLVALLANVYPGSEQALTSGLGGAGDESVWEYAKLHGLTIVSKDSDFFDLSKQAGAPPKVIWVRFGNCSTRTMELLLRNYADAVLKFGDSQEACLVLRRR